MTLMSIPRPEHRPHIKAAATDPYERGFARGEQLREGIPAAIEVYDRLFALGGITAAQVREDAERALEAIGRFRPAAHAEITGIAKGAGAEEWRVAALNARTEILARSVAVPPGECTTIVRRDGASGTFGVQTWDWHVELNGMWHTLESRGGAHDVVGLTENGILGKMGVNSAGLALHFNILGHVDDGIGGIPVHVLAAIVLEEAGSVAEAVEIIRGAPLASSGSFALFDERDAVLLDMSPVGIFEMRPENGTLLRTNHFLTPTPATGEKTWLYQPDSGERYDFVRDRLARRQPPTTVDELADFLVTGAGEPRLPACPTRTCRSVSAGPASRPSPSNPRRAPPGSSTARPPTSAYATGGSSPPH